MQSGRLARVKRGFLISVVLAVAGTAFVSASLLGAWAWTTARAVVFQLVIGDLQHVGDVTEASLSEAVTLAFGELSGDAREIASGLASTHREELDEELKIIVGSNKRLLQADIVDTQGRGLAERSATSAKEPLNATGVAYALQGKEFASDPYFSAAFDRYILYLATPVRDENNVVRTALTSRYDVQAGLQDVSSESDSGKQVMRYSWIVMDTSSPIPTPSGSETTFLLMLRFSGLWVVKADG